MFRDEVILHQEKLLLDVETRASRAALEARLAAEFHEIGSSGHHYERESCISGLLSEPCLNEQIELQETRFHRLAENVVLLTYQAHGKSSGKITLRSSVWVKKDKKWILAFHQGTKT